MLNEHTNFLSKLLYERRPGTEYQCPQKVSSADKESSWSNLMEVIGESDLIESKENAGG